MLGAMFGDIVGSVYEFHNIKTKEFPLFCPKSKITDDSVMTVAVADALMQFENAIENTENFKEVLIDKMHEYGRRYPNSGYGGHFRVWLALEKRQPYNSFGNGSAMRVSPVAWYAKTLDEALELAKATAEVTHNHSEGIKGAVVTAGAAFLARTGHGKDEIADFVKRYYDIDFTVDGIRPTYRFDVTCQGSVPQAIVCFLDSESFEDAIRNCISIGGDCDTTAAICGAVAQGYYGMTDEQKAKVFERIDERMSLTVADFCKKYINA
ncbi:MAG: ADP-ribosylglycohydrolase family protein [Clostridia bacterium]|nr:ADP-ribosylglycohydrolase family protein [Clostridia bacterium]